MLSLYRPGNGILHRIGAGWKVLLLAVAMIGLSILPSTWAAAGIAFGGTVLAYVIAGLPSPVWGVRELAKAAAELKWLLLIVLVGQLLFTPIEPAISSTLRILAAVALAGLLTLTTPTSELLDFTERALYPLKWARIDPARVALLLAITLAAVPSLMRAGNQVREAQRARGSRGNMRHFTLAFLILSLKHADEVGEALAARGAE